MDEAGGPSKKDAYLSDRYLQRPMHVGQGSG